MPSRCASENLGRRPQPQRQDRRIRSGIRTTRRIRTQTLESKDISVELLIDRREAGVYDHPDSLPDKRQYYIEVERQNTYSASVCISANAEWSEGEAVRVALNADGQYVTSFLCHTPKSDPDGCVRLRVDLAHMQSGGCLKEFEFGFARIQHRKFQACII